MKTLTKDFEHILEKTANLWEPVRNKTILVTGGTGFFGIWLQLSFSYINKKLGLNARMVVLTRNKAAFLNKYPMLGDNNEVSFIEGDICSFDFPEQEINFIIHAATEASVKLNLESPMGMFETIVNGTKRILELAVDKKVESFLFTSSGAIYGNQPCEIEKIKETYLGGPNSSDAGSVYGEGKRMAEVLCSVYNKSKNLPVKIARCYAFVGPFLPLKTHFAIGNFIANVLNNEDIHIQGDGTPFRSYMYASDLMIWLWSILIRGKENYPYNVGSDKSISIEILAKKVSRNSSDNNSQIIIAQAKKNVPAFRYVPSIERAKKELGLDISIGIDEAIKKTINFYKKSV